MTEEARGEDLRKLEKLHRDALARRVADFHRSTRTSLRRFQNLHLKLRDRIFLYRAWHNFRFANLIHCFVLLAVISSWGVYFYKSFSLISAAQTKPGNYLVIFGPRLSFDLKAGMFHRSNIDIGKKFTEIQDKNVSVGYIQYRGYTHTLVDWKNVTWEADVPEGSSIVYRIRTTKNDSEGLMKSEWSGYYPIKGEKITSKGVPLIKSRILEVEVIFQGDNNSWPRLHYLSFGYTPFKENQFILNFRDNLFSWLRDFFRFVQRKEGIYSD